MLRNIYTILVVLLVGLTAAAHGQTAQIQGRVSDSSEAVIAKATIRVLDQRTNTVRKTQTNEAGQYVVSGLNPSVYKIYADAAGFSTTVSKPITLNVDQNAVLDFVLHAGGTSETVTVEGNGAQINTTDATVSSVIDRQFVENMPLNGRSFQSLILLTPGVVTASPQGSDTYGDFSVNGQRTDSNSYYMDGASAEHGTSLTGTGHSATTLGTTQSIVSVDALQEFRIATSTFSAEYGRSPGAQISFTSRSGTNDYHGTAFDYLRNYAFDANNWFNTYATVPIPKPQERQNDFGATLGGPVRIPWLYNGKDRAFFFFNYEGLRLNTPSAANIKYVPTNGTGNLTEYANSDWGNLRAYAPDILKPLLNGFPLPNCTVQQDPQCVDYKDGLLPALLTANIPSTINAPSFRIDYILGASLRAFFRYNRTNSTSSAVSWGINTIDTVGNTSTYLLGADSVFRESMTNELRVQYAPSYSTSISTGKPIEGSVPVTGQSSPNLQTMQGFPSTAGGISEFQLYFPNETSTTIRPILYFINGSTAQDQMNGVDTFTWSYRRHVFKAGADYRQSMTTQILPQTAQATLGIYNYFDSATNVLDNTQNSLSASMKLKQDFIAKSLGMFFQDEWRVTPRLSLSLGLRWDLNPAISIVGAQSYTILGNVHNPATVELSSLGHQLYPTSYTNFGPRVGAAYVLHNESGHQTVLRLGGGLFYDNGQRVSTTISGSLGTGNAVSASNFNFPYSATTILTPEQLPPAPPYELVWGVDNHLIAPSTVHYSAALEQAFGSGQQLTISYVGNTGRNLIQYATYYLAPQNPEFSYVEEYSNGPGSNYNSLQVKFQRQMVKGLQFLVNYTWSHALDSASTTLNQIGAGYMSVLQYGNSDHDVRHNFTTAVVYNLPSNYSNLWKREILGHWSADLWFVARSAFPVQLIGTTFTDPASGDEVSTRLNWNGQDPYLHVKGIPGGRQFNPSVFSAPTTAQGPNGNSPRNFLRGFGENEADFAVDREFPIYKQTHLQFRAEAYNIFNHPNFGPINASCGANAAGAVCTNSIMGQATGTLSSAALGGLSSLYQHGGPRSLQFELKLQY